MQPLGTTIQFASLFNKDVPRFGKRLSPLNKTDANLRLVASLC